MNNNKNKRHSKDSAASLYSDPLDALERAEDTRFEKGFYNKHFPSNDVLFLKEFITARNSARSTRRTKKRRTKRKIKSLGFPRNLA